MSDSKELSAHDGRREVATASVDSARGMLAMIAEAARDPSVDANKMVTLAKLATDMQDRERQAEFNRAKIAAIRAMPAIYKRGNNTHLNARYAKFEDLHRAAMPVLTRHGLILDFRVGSEGRDITVQPILRHENGYIEEGGVMRAPPADGNKGTNNVQVVAITTSYLKRHSMKAMLNIIEDGEDQDGSFGQADRQLNDRQEAMIVEAQGAADTGQYPAWFGKLTPKDKAWMISTGRHAQLGGAPALPGAAQPVEQAQSDPTPADAPKAAKQTAEEWAEQFQRDVAQTENRAALADLQNRNIKALDKLRVDKPDLYKTVARAIGDRNLDFSADDNQAGPADAQRGEGSTLFGEN